MRSEGPALMPVFRSQHQAELLMWVLLHPDTEFTLSELATRLDIPLSTLHREIGRLDEAALITSRSQGRSRLVRANVGHPGARALTELLEVTFGPRAVIADEFGALDAQLVLIFGSWAARYTGQTGPPPNDVDVMVVGDAERSAVYEAADRAETKLGLPVNPVIRSLARWEKSDDALVAQIKAAPFATIIDRTQHPEMTA